MTLGGYGSKFLELGARKGGKLCFSGQWTIQTIKNKFKEGNSKTVNIQCLVCSDLPPLHYLSILY